MLKVITPFARTSLLVALLAMVFALQVRWLDDLEDARLAEQQRLITGAVDRVAADLDAIVERIAESVMLNWPQRMRDEDAALVASIRDDEQAPENGERVAVEVGLVLRVQRLDGTVARVELDRTALRERAIPAVVRRSLGMALAEDVVISIHADGDPLYRSHAFEYGQETVDARAPTLRPPAGSLALFADEESTWTPVGLELAGSMPDSTTRASSPYEVTAHHREGSLAAAVAKQRARELMLAAATLVLLALAIVSVWRGELRARRLAESELAFVAGVSHELRTPLAALRLASSNLGRGVIREPSEVAAYGELLERQVTRMTALSERVLSFADGNANQQRTHLDLAALIRQSQDVADVWEGRRRVTFVEQIDASIHDVELIGDPDAILSALENLIDNAIKYGPDEQTVLIEVHGRDGNATIHMTDEGCGIPRSERSRLLRPFERGHRTHEAGSGLGLAVAVRVADAHGGSVTLDDAPGGGTRATLTLRST